MQATFSSHPWLSSNHAFIHHVVPSVWMMNYSNNPFIRL